MFLKKSFQSVLVALLVLVVLTPAASVFAGKKDDTLNIAWSRELETLDRYHNAAREGVIVSRHINDDLIYRDPVTMEYKGLLATSWKWIDDITMEFELRKGVVFHNGEKFDADDVVFTVNHFSDPETKARVQRNVNWLKKAEKIGPYKVRLSLKKPFPAALEYLAGNLPIYPNEYYAKVGSQVYGVKPVGTGPYKVVEVEPTKKIVFERNDNYFKGSPKGQPTIKRIVQRTISETTTSVAELMTGGIDWLYYVPKDQAEKLAMVPSVKTVKGGTFRISYLVLDAAGRTGKTPFTDLRVRQAFNHAIDRAAISKNLVGGSSRVINSMCFPTQFGCTKDVKTYDYNPARAKELLTEAGYANGLEIDLYGYRDPSYGEAVAGYLKKAGIQANFKLLRYAALDELSRAGKAACVNWTWGSYGVNDVSSITARYFDFGPHDFARDKKVNEWLEAGNTNIDSDYRKEVYSKALRRIAEQAYTVPLFSYTVNYAFNKDLNFTPHTDAVPRFFIANWK